MIEIPAALSLLGTISGKVFDFVQKHKSRKLMKSMASDIATISYEAQELSHFLKEEFLWVRDKLESISEWFADEIQRDALSSFSYIYDAINTSITSNTLIIDGRYSYWDSFHLVIGSELGTSLMHVFRLIDLYNNSFYILNLC